MRLPTPEKPKAFRKGQLKRESVLDDELLSS